MELDYTESDATVRDYCKGSTYEAKNRTVKGVTSHLSHSVEFITITDTYALCCHTCRIITPF